MMYFMKCRVDQLLLTWILINIRFFLFMIKLVTMKFSESHRRET